MKGMVLLIRDVALGQFFPGESTLHKMDPRVKIALAMVQVTLVFLADNFFSLTAVALQVLLIITASKISLKTYFKSIKMVLFLITFTAILNLFYSAGDPIFSFWILKITREGINNSIFVAVRVVSLILASSALTFTTSPTDITDALERLMKPLAFFKVRVHEIAMMMTIALRFIPTLLEETDKIMNAQKARGADFENGGLINKIRSMLPILVPLFVSSFRRAYELALAMECRCYQGGNGRTKMKTLHITSRDIAGIGFVGVFLTLLIAFNVFFPNTPR
ncbi:MAG: energy-coupling factor transporter transmembrane protein EcfT [Oscillospiraceae bacterium]|nr:energy-coupling factor transporter transmembrane protein EcfT [Oscillospiraceae bacterium]